MKTKDFHIAPALSCIDILVALYDNILTENDKFILSKGHACLSLYIMLLKKGLNPDINKHHPDIDIENGIECTTGSLGHGLPISVGMALAKKLKNEKGFIYVLLSDGECQEGTTWESIQIAVHHKLDNLIIIIDNNKLQSLDFIKNILSSPTSLYDKFKSFGIKSLAIADGHNITMLTNMLKESHYNSPKVIIANTIKGKGISFIENKPEWHARFPTEEEYKKGCEELLENG